MKSKCEFCKICNKPAKYHNLQLCQKHYMIEYKKKKNSSFRPGFKDKKCIICGNIFIPKSATAKYCGKDCKRIGRNKTNRELRRKPIINKICKHCGNCFITSRNFQKVCTKCRKGFILQNKKKYYYNILKPKFGYLNRGQSYPQKYIYEIIKKTFRQYVWEYNNRSVIKNPATNHTLELDIWCAERNFAIEFDGNHHFSSKQYGEQKLLEVQNSDYIKNCICKEKNIKLIRISYKDPWKDISWLISRVEENLMVE